MANAPERGRTLIVDLRRRELIAAAMEVIATQGFEGATVRDIARAAGASLGSVNYYFPSKEDLCRAAIKETDAGFRALVKDAVDLTEGYPEKLERVVDMCFPVEAGDGFNWPVFVAFWNQAAQRETYRDIFDEGHRDWIAMLVEVLTEGAMDGSLALRSAPEDEAVAFAALIDGLALYTVVTTRIEVKMARRLAKDYIDALRPAEALRRRRKS